MGKTKAVIRLFVGTVRWINSCGMFNFAFVFEKFERRIRQASEPWPAGTRNEKNK